MKRSQYEILAALASSDDARAEHTTERGWEVGDEIVRGKDLKELAAAGFLVQEGRAWFSAYRATERAFAALPTLQVNGALCREG